MVDNLPFLKLDNLTIHPDAIQESIKQYASVLNRVNTLSNNLKTIHMKRIINDPVNINNVSVEQIKSKFEKINVGIRDEDMTKLLPIIDSMHDFFEGKRQNSGNNSENITFFLPMISDIILKEKVNSKTKGKQIKLIKQIFSDLDIDDELDSLVTSARNKSATTQLIKGIKDQLGKIYTSEINFSVINSDINSATHSPILNNSFTASVGDIKEYTWYTIVLSLLKNRINHRVTSKNLNLGIPTVESKIRQVKCKGKNLMCESFVERINTLSMTLSHVMKYVESKDSLLCIDAKQSRHEFKLEAVKTKNLKCITPAQIFDPATTAGLSLKGKSTIRFIFKNEEGLEKLMEMFKGKFDIKLIFHNPENIYGDSVYYQGKNEQIDVIYHFFIISSILKKPKTTYGVQRIKQEDFKDIRFICVSEYKSKSNIRNFLDFCIIHPAAPNYVKEMFESNVYSGTNNMNGKKVHGYLSTTYQNPGVGTLASLFKIMRKDPSLNKEDMKRILREMFDFKRSGDNFQVSFTKEYNKNTKKKLFILTHDLLMSNFCMIDNVPVILNTNGVYYIFDSV